MTVEQKAEEYRKDIKSKFFLSEPQLDLACQGFKDGYHECQKEHKWHYPSKGELPKDEKEVLVYMWGSFYIGSYKQYTDDNNAWHFNDFDEESEQITAWKEIVPPKENE